MSKSRYIISYDLIDDKDYEAVEEAIKSYETYARIVESTWIVETSESASLIFDKLDEATDYDDRFFVVDAGDDYYYRLHQDTADWIEDVFPASIS